MAKIQIKHLDCEFDNNFLEVEAGYYPAKDIGVISVSGKFQKVDFMIDMDISTAIKFSKTLRTEINKIKS